MNIDTDKQYQDDRIETVTETANGWEVTFDGSMVLFVPNEQCKAAPQPGETLRTYGRGFGFIVRGIAINGRVYRYRTEAEDAQDHRDMVARQKAEKAADYEAKRADFDARVAALPEQFRTRIERFRDLGGNEWRYEFEPYELFTCEQAAVIAEAVITVDELAVFCKLSYEEQRLRVPKLDGGHSGNTFGMACQLARCLIEQPELLPKMHGAMCALVGCQEYGCFAAHEAKGSPLYVRNEERHPEPHTIVQFWTYKVQCVGRRNAERGDGHEWEDLTEQDACGDCETYSDEQVTFWAPLLPAPPSTGEGK